MPCETVTPPLSERLHPRVLAEAVRLAGGHVDRITVVSRCHAEVDTTPERA